METQADPDAPRPQGRGKRIAWVIGGLAVVAAVAGYAGSNGNTQWSDEGVVEDAAEKPAASTAKPAAEQAPKGDGVDAIRGVVRSRLEATISSRITATVTSMPYREGQSFPQGALLASFDCSTLKAQHSAANAATAAYRKTYQTNVELDSFQAVGRNDVEISKANMDKAGAEAEAIATQLKDCAIYAPFAGIVVEQIGHAHEVAASGQPLLKIQNAGDLEVSLIVPSHWLTWLRQGTAFQFKIDETGETVSGQVARLGGSVDPVSKTLRISGTLSAASGPVLPGMSGSAHFDVPAEGKVRVEPR